MKKILIMGATSAIAEAVAREFAKQGDCLFLVARGAEKLGSVKADLKVRGAQDVQTRVYDANDLAGLPALLEDAYDSMAGLDTALIAHGTLSEQECCEASPEETLSQFQTNALSYIALCTLLANRFEAQRKGTLVVITSVAGDRGRQSNYVYGAAKAAVSAFTSGMRQRLHKHGVSVITVKPGFVDSPMTAHLRKGPLWATPERVAKAIVGGMARNAPVIYAPWFWWVIMQIIVHIPERIFRRLKL